MRKILLLLLLAGLLALAICTSAPAQAIVQLTDNTIENFSSAISGPTLPVSSTAAPATYAWTITHIATIYDAPEDPDVGYSIYRPEVSGDRVAWVGHDSSDYEIYSWTLGGGTVMLTDNAYDDRWPKVSGDRVVWQGRQDGSDYEIYTWTPGGGTVMLTDNAYDEWFPQVSGDRVVWWGSTDGFTSDVYSWTPGGGTVKLTDNVYYDDYPQVSGDRVVWWYGYDGFDDDIFTWTPGGGTVRLTNNAFHDRYPNVSGDRVVWLGRPDGSDWEIFTWTSGGGTVRLTDNAYSDVDTQVSGDRVVWVGYYGGSGYQNRDIFTWTPGGGTVRLTDNAYYDGPPQLSGGRVVWYGYDGSDNEIYTWTPGGVTVRLTDDGYDDRYPEVSGDRVVWGRSSGSDREIFTAVPGTRVDDTDPSCVYAQVWSRWDHSGYWAAYQDTYAYTDRDGDQMSFTFEGTYACWVAATSNTKGMAQVSLYEGDVLPGNLVSTETVDLYSPTTLWKQNVYDTGTLAEGVYTIVIECLHEKNPASWWYTVDVDAFDILGVPVARITKIDDKDYTYCTYLPGIASGASTSEWSRWDASGYWAAYQDTYAYTDQADYEMTFTFHGTYASWVACTSNTKGKAEVVLDGDTAHPVVVDLYSRTTQWKKNVYSTGFLTDGTHTITIRCLREKNPASWWYTIDVDRFEILETVP